MNKRKISFPLALLSCVLFINSARCQQIPEFSWSVGTLVPYQHYLRLGYNFQLDESLSSLRIYSQLGVTPSNYNQFIMETSIEDNEIGKEYLKANLKGELGFGLGTQWFYKNWNLDVGINLVRYQIKDKSSKELVEAIASQNIGLRETLDDLTGNSAVFSDLYSNYLISPRPNALQLLVKGGYEFPVNKQKSLKLGVDIGVATTMHSFVHIDSQRTSRLAEILLATVTPTLSDRLENLVNWKMIPFAGIGLVYQIPARNVRSY